MIYIVVVSFVLLIVAAYLWVLSKGIARRDDDLYVAFEGLVECPSESPFLLINRVFGREFLQFERYVIDGRSGIRLVFPIRQWSLRYEERLIQELRVAGFEYNIVQGEGGHFITVDFGSDSSAAQRCSQTILRNVFGFSSRSMYRVHLEP